jgi:AAA domain
VHSRSRGVPGPGLLLPMVDTAESPSALDPAEVFTPRKPPSREMFTRRSEPDLHGNPGVQNSLRDALREPGGQVILFGDTGVGKSTLLQYVAEDVEMGVLSVQCRSKRSFDFHVDQAIREITTERDIEVIRDTSKEGGFEAGVSNVITLKGHVTNQKGQQVRVELVEREPLLALAETMESAELRLLVFDNFQNVDESERQAFAQAFEVLSDRAGETGDVKIVVVGIASDAATLVGGSGSVQRRTTQIGVPRMPDDEIVDIFKNGFRLLDLRTDGTALSHLVFYCDGFPYFAHLLGLAVARHVLDRGDDLVDRDTVLSALARTAKSVEASFAERVTLAFERGGHVQPRRRILQALCLSTEREWRSADVVNEYRRLHDLTQDPKFLLAALGELIQPKRGNVLSRSGTERHYVYRFSDPYLRPYLRMTHFTEPVQQRLW